MSRQVSPATERVYGLERVTRIWGVSRATVYRHRRPAAVTRKRPGPRGAMADEGIHPVWGALRDGRRRG
jgi:putative transposase